MFVKDIGYPSNIPLAKKFVILTMTDDYLTRFKLFLQIFRTSSPSWMNICLGYNFPLAKICDILTMTDDHLLPIFRTPLPWWMDICLGYNTTLWPPPIAINYLRPRIIMSHKHTPDLGESPRFENFNSPRSGGIPQIWKFKFPQIWENPPDLQFNL